MLPKQDLEVLFYTPKEHTHSPNTLVLDGVRDPNYYKNMFKIRDFVTKMEQCDIKDYIETVLYLFKDKYSNSLGIEWLFSEKRTEINSAIISYVENYKSVSNIINKITISFTNVDLLIEIINQFVADKTTKIDNKNDGFIYFLHNSPIIKISIQQNTIEIYLDTEKYIYYPEIY
jgi:hypothetical protein